jgi:hypothetical protein
MSQGGESIYPDLLRTGLGRVQSLGGTRDLVALFAALEQFRRELQVQEDIPGILRATADYAAGLDFCHTMGFYLVQPKDFSFDLALCVPAEATEPLRKLVASEIHAGRFAWALRQSAPVFFLRKDASPPTHGIFHSMALANRTVGMFCGLLKRSQAPGQDIATSLLSMLLGNCADALAGVQKTAALTQEINTLSGLLPICAWCKKIRDDQGYWKQIEIYVEKRTHARFSHGVCPDCMAKLMATPVVGKSPKPK